MKIAIIIPARFASSRFPGKPLALIDGKPMILHTAERASLAFGREVLWIATDSQEIAKAVQLAGFQAIMTSESCFTGTDRVAEAARRIDADIYVNVQGDEPLVDPGDIQKIVEEKMKHPDAIINGMALLSKDEDPNSRHIPKVISNESGRLIYISRLPIPGSKISQAKKYYKQVCIYAFSKQDLQLFSQLGRKSLIEKEEDIEILRFFEFNATIKMVLLKNNAIAVDQPEDIKKVEEYLACEDTSHLLSSTSAFF